MADSIASWGAPSECFVHLLLVFPKKNQGHVKLVCLDLSMQGSSTPLFFKTLKMYGGQVLLPPPLFLLIKFRAGIGFPKK